ncbi:MAG TPA: DUF4124 domain-containing protein [Rhodanobacteraceae bacterium]|nr:DUF4124 domain-containing protein [Rhodanobacteraceae bacterium]
MSRLLAPAVLAVAALALAASAGAQVYKWKDASGIVHYSDAPPTNGTNYQKVRLSSNTATPVSATPVTAASAAAGAVPAAGAQPAPASTAKIPDTADNRAKLCKDLSNNITLLDSSQPLTAGDASSPQQNMSDVQRRQELATARAQKQLYCAGG